jgi:hypothetical protein
MFIQFIYPFFLKQSNGQLAILCSLDNNGHGKILIAV